MLKLLIQLNLLLVMKLLLKNKNRIKISLTIILVVFLFNFPNFYGYLFPPENKVYLGQVSFFDPWDVNVYVSVIRWSQTYGPEFQNAYTTTPHKVTFLYPFYTLVGILFSNIEPFLLFNILTTLAGAVLLLVIFKT